MKLTCRQPVPNPHGEGSPWTCMRGTFFAVFEKDGYGEDTVYFECSRCGYRYTDSELVVLNQNVSTTGPIKSV